MLLGIDATQNKNYTKCFYMLELCPTIRVTRQNAFRPLESSGPFHSGIYPPRKNRIFKYMWVWFIRSKALHLKKKLCAWAEMCLMCTYIKKNFCAQKLSKMNILSYKWEIAYENSVFARVPNSTMKRARALQWPESVLVSNPYSGKMLKHIKTFV